MFSHIVVFWTDPNQPDAPQKVAEGAKRYLPGIPGLEHFHVGQMVGSERPIVEQSYQVALNTVFTDKAAQDAYQVHPQHLEFVEKIFKPLCVKAVIYDFE